MSFIPFITIPFIYFLTALLKPYIQPKLRFKICAICIAVSLTWLLMIGLWLIGWDIQLEAIAVLMGMSITGIMYAMERTYSKENIRNFWLVRLILIVGGYAAIIELLQREWNLLILTTITALIIIAIVSLLFQGTTHRAVIKEQENLGRKKSLIKRLEDCC